MKRILVISPHPDDEAIGCGGTLRDHATQGDIVRVIFLTSGEKGGHGRSPEETGPLREREAQTAAQILGISQLEFWRQPDGACHATRRIVDRLCATIAEWKPAVLYVTHGKEMHSDHRAAARIVQRAMYALKSITGPVVRMYEVWTPLQHMDEIVDISSHIDDKVAAIRAHKSQCNVLRFDEAILGLNRYRGELFSWPDGDYAEIFVEMQL
jgi:N-acetylglucosamine malate deacetylase 1